MPEGPSIVLLKEAISQFSGKKVLEVYGNTKTIDITRLLNKKVIDFKSWGKHFLICFKGFTVRVHFLLFGSYLVNETKKMPVRLGIAFKNGTLNLYACSVKIIEGDILDQYDWTADVMNDSWDANKARLKLKQSGDALICDNLLEQSIFAGVGNIIKNEILFLARVHPATITRKVPAKKITYLIKEARDYSFRFLAWKRVYELKKHFLVHTKSVCTICNGPIKRKHLGTKNRKNFYCEHCQKLYK